jgi:hypothetical protein
MQQTAWDGMTARPRSPVCTPPSHAMCAGRAPPPIFLRWAFHVLSSHPSVSQVSNQLCTY